MDRSARSYDANSARSSRDGTAQTLDTRERFRQVREGRARNRVDRQLTRTFHRGGARIGRPDGRGKLKAVTYGGHHTWSPPRYPPWTNTNPWIPV